VLTRILDTVADSTPVGLNRIERILAVMIASSAGLSIVCIVVVFIAQVAGETDFAGGAWPVIRFLPLVGLPIAFAFLVVLLVASVVRRRRLDSRGGR